MKRVILTLLITSFIGGSALSQSEIRELVADPLPMGDVIKGMALDDDRMPSNAEIGKSVVSSGEADSYSDTPNRIKIFGPATLGAPLTANCYVDRFPSGSEIADGVIKTIIKGGVPPYSVTYNEGNVIRDILVETDTVIIAGLRTGPLEIGVSDQNAATANYHIDLPAPQTDLVLLTHYPLQSNLEDTLAVHQDLITSNIELVPGEGLFTEGLPNSADTFNQIQTRLTELDMDDFYISLDVKLDSITGNPGRNEKNIFLLGKGRRWLAPIYFQNGKSIALSYNNFTKTLSNFTPIEYDRWYEIAVSYNADTKRLRLLMDRQVIVSDTATLNTDNDDSFVLWCNCGAEPMRGHWRNLRVYGPEEITTSAEETGYSIPLKIYPNPARERLNIQLLSNAKENQYLSIYSSTGVLYRKIEVGAGTPLLELDISRWPSGFYLVRMGSSTSSFIKR